MNIPETTLEHIEIKAPPWLDFQMKVASAYPG